MGIGLVAFVFMLSKLWQTANGFQGRFKSVQNLSHSEMTVL